MWPSKRKTKTGVVLEALTKPKPSGQSTRKPSIVVTTAGASKCDSATSFSTNACGSPSIHGTLSSGVEKLVGSACSNALESATLLTISNRRQPAYVPSSKPNHRSLKKMWPLISPPKGEFNSRIFALINECPVLNIKGTPPAALMAGARR